MIRSLLQPEVQKFILDHEQDDEKKLILSQRTVHDVPAAIIADQIRGRRKAKTKLPLYYNARNIVYPQGLNLEQSSSEKTAVFKASALRTVLGESKTITDLTGGFGIDSLFFSKAFKKVVFAEPNASLLELARHNHGTLGSSNLEYHSATAEEFLQVNSVKTDCFFIDPSRRDQSSKKVFMLSDCEPGIPKLLPILFEKSACVLLKTSPLLDIQQGIKELQGVERVWVVSVDNECKELLFFCRKTFTDDPQISAVDIQGDHGDQSEFSFSLQEERNAAARFSRPLSYLYEPNASVMKAGAFKLICKRLPVFKLHPNTHLYTSKDLVEDFPGRIFTIINIVKPDASALKKIFPKGKANVITRNYPLTVEQLKKKTKLRDGGDLYLLAFSGEREKFLAAANRIK